jgi:flagellar hook protein FlgE
VQGGVETTNSATDLAIQGDGLFILKDAQGGTFYSRAGQFNVDADGHLVNPGGLTVQGITLDSNGNPTSGVTDIVTSQLVAAPVATTKIELALNLDSTETVPVLALPADAAGTSALPGTWFAGANFSTVVTTIDSLGQAHDLTFLFRKTATPNEWSYRVVTNGGEITGGTVGEMQQINGAGGRIAFNSDGTLDTTAPTNLLVTANGPIAWANGASAQTIAAVDTILIGSTQFSLPSAVSQATQDGTAAGILKGFSINSEGILTGQFTSGQTTPLYRVVLGDFANPQGLTHLGNSLYVQSNESGEALVGNAGTGRFGTLLSGSLELSSVDLATEFVKMVTTQRGFQASSRTITVTDTLLEEITNLKR